EVSTVVFSIPFVVVMGIGILQVVGNAAFGVQTMYGTDLYPTTATMIRIINGAFSLPLLVVLVYYSGEIMSRERSVKVSEMLDAMPHSDWVMLAAKLATCVMVIVIMLLSVVLATIAVQLVSGFDDIRLLQYLLGVFFFFHFPLYLMCVMAVLGYLVTRNKYAAMFVMVLYMVYLLAMPQTGFDHYLYLMTAPNPPYSDFTGYTHRLDASLWFSFYWFLWGVLVLMVARLIWPRGSEDRLSVILRTARQRFSSPMRSAMAIMSLAIFITGSWIYYNTDVLNDHVTDADRETISADYEKAWKQYEYLTMPEIKNVYAEVDIYPHDNEVRLKGRYLLVNHSDESLDAVHFSVATQLQVGSLEVEGASLVENDERLGYRIYQLDRPLLPGESLNVAFETGWLSPGFSNRAAGLKVVANGTFFDNTDVFPLVGYVGGRELRDNSRRRKYDLPPLQRARKIDDPEGRQWGAFRATQRTDFETVVSTAENQIAIAPGYLQKEWVENGRRYFHYKMDEPIWNFYSFVSADYKVKKERRNGIDIEVYYVHDYNIDRMIEATQKSLNYFQTNFSPYQYRQFRILEFPQYQGRFAQSFPNTIPFSEGIGFVADLTDKSSIDYVFYVTAHELAHQWWAHQVMGADTQGSTMIVESLAQYSALMVMKEEYGEETMRRFLKYELDSYLRGRGGELIEELPLYLVENQPYIHYNKGSVNLYALQDYMGEAAVNRALQQLIAEFGGKGAPFPRTIELLDRIREQAGSAHETLITDLFEKIVVFDLKVKDQSFTPLPDGRWEVSMDLSLRKFEADGEGLETEVPLDMMIDIGVLGQD
ncbi:MAG: M1 family aminopeptidase, partial [Gammaproteobacteria bacterium]|nr:M1 family aminopeptidase [Gammaproteobacteria bacterium]